MVRRHSGVLLAVASLTLVATFAATPASASEIITRNARNISLKVDGKGHAVISYTRGAKRYHPVVWGAVNGRVPQKDRKQVMFRKDYSGGYMRLGYPLWKTIKNRCRPYDGPKLSRFVVGCKAPDGSYWALQRWQRRLPNLGYKPWTKAQKVRELHVSHWTGALAKLELHADWAYSTNFHHIFGRMTYRGVGVYGFGATRTGSPTDDYGRNVYLDTWNSRYSDGWRRENAFLTHRRAGNFCYLFFARKSYYDSSTRPSGNGKSYRLTAIGPGVTPDVTARTRGLPNFDENNPDQVDLEARMDVLNRQLAVDDTSNTPCVNN